MRRLAGFGSLILLAVSLSAFSAETWKGKISDKMCGADHKGHDAVACVKNCVKGGSPYVFVVGTDKVLDIENQKDARIAASLDKFAGKSVTVTGTMSKDGKSVTIASIKGE